MLLKILQNQGNVAVDYHLKANDDIGKTEDGGHHPRAAVTILIQKSCA